MPKRSHPNSTDPHSHPTDQAPKRPRTDDPLFLAAGPDSPMTDMSDNGDDTEELEALPNPSATESELTRSSAVAVSTVPQAVAESTTNRPTSVTDKSSEVNQTAITPVAALDLLKQLGVNPEALVGGDVNKLRALIAAVGGPPSTEVTVASQVPAESTAPPNPAHAATETQASNSGGSSHSADTNEKELAIEALVELGVARARVENWNVTELRRLRVLLTWADSTTDTYNITSAPTKLGWGTPSPFNNHGNILCHEDTSKPITFWIPVELSGQWWFDNDGYPAARPAIAGQPLVEHVPDYCRTQLNERCMPTSSSKVAEQFGPSQIKASRWMNERGQKGQPAKTFEFKAVYDARKNLRDKVLLQQLNVSQLKVRDIVVLEVQIGRYSVKDDNASNKGKRRAMERWQAFYDLLAVYKIKDASEPVAVAVPASTFSI